MVEGVRGVSLVSFRRALIPFIRGPSSWPHDLPKATPPHSVTVGVMFEQKNFSGTNISSP